MRLGGCYDSMILHKDLLCCRHDCSATWQRASQDVQAVEVETTEFELLSGLGSS